MEMKQRFSDIYKTAAWAGRTGVLSGSGSTIQACERFQQWISETHPKSILDIGCGDLEWISGIEKIRSGSIKYCGIDVVSTLIEHHRRVFPWFTGECLEATQIEDDRGAELVICKDVLFHLSTNDAIDVLRKIAAFNKWRFLAITTHRTANNTERKSISGSSMAPFNVMDCGVIHGKEIEAIRRPDGGEIIVIDRAFTSSE